MSGVHELARHSGRAKKIMCISQFFSDYKEYHTDTTVKFVIKLSAEKLDQAEEQGVHKVFKLQTPLSTSSMVSIA